MNSKLNCKFNFLIFNLNSLYLHLYLFRTLPGVKLGNFSKRKNQLRIKTTGIRYVFEIF